MGLFGENTGSTISAAGSLLGAGIGAVSQGSMNKKTREWNEKQYALQRENALADWNMQNAYNSPEQQMSRLKAAGLNPNLVYGNGATAMSSAPPRATESKAWQPKAPLAEFNPGSVVGSYLDTQIKKQTLTNMDAQEKVLRQEALSRAADIIGKGISNNRSTLAYDIEQATRDNVIARSGVDLDLQRNRTISEEWKSAYTAGSMNRLEKQIQLLGDQMAVTKAQRDAIRQNIENAKKDGMIKQFEIELNKKSITKSDPAYLRMAKQLLDEIMKSYGN